MPERADYGLELLLSLNGHEFEFTDGHVVKYRVRKLPASRNRPGGIKYSLTLHDLGGKRIYGIDNAHKVRGRTEFDNRHLYEGNAPVAYHYRDPVVLLEDFLREVEQVLKQRAKL
ncbi:MAG: toxin-antitoxin system TumE family protein [Gammaproteobacteria bacterium]